jgi:fatty-acyl-CoA synthase
MIHADVLGERARLTPDKIALVDVDTQERLTYRQLDERATRCAQSWQRLGLAKGDRVAILAHNRIEYLEVFFAAAKTGHVLVTLSTRLTPHELAHIVRDSRITALLYAGELATTARALRELVEVPLWIALDEPLAAGDPSYRKLLADTDPAGFSRVRCDPEDVYCLLYTSGTTGRPKGVMIPHRMVAWNGFNTVCSWQLREDDVSPIFTPLYHAGALMAFLGAMVTIGGTIVLHHGFDLGEIWRTIEAEGCTVVLGVPTIWKLLMEAPEFATADLSRVRWFISGGAPLPHYIVEAYQARGVVFRQGFGMTEVGINNFAMTNEDSSRKIGSIGQPMMFVEVRLVDAEGRDVPTGEVGEILLGGPHRSLGYWNDPEATAAAFDRQGWYHSGDLARRDEDGFFWIAGRLKDMIISGGVNVYPAEIEAELVRHPEVEDAAVVGIPDETWGEASVAFVVPRPGADLSPEALAAHLAQRLARFKVPKHYRFVKALPRTPYGKVVKAELRRQFQPEGGRP